VSVSDMVHIRAMTEWVAGIPTEMGGSGNPAPYTAHGTYLGMKQAVLHKHNTDSLSGMRILVEGLGSVGYLLAKKLHNEGAELIVCDVNELKVQKALAKFGCKSVPLDHRFEEKFDMFVFLLVVSSFLSLWSLFLLLLYFFVSSDVLPSFGVYFF
jgi:leucine dehydrogenase